MTRNTRIILFLGLSILVILGVSILIKKQAKMTRNNRNNLIAFSACILKHQNSLHLSRNDMSRIKTLAQKAQRELSDIQNQFQEETAMIDSQLWESTFETIKFDKLLERKNDLLKQEASITFNFYQAVKKIISDAKGDIQSIEQICR